MGRSSLERNNVRFVGEGHKTLVFAHGFGSDQSTWAAQERAFCHSHRLVFFDHVGATKSTMTEYTPKRYGTFERYALDFMEILEMAGVNNAILVGHAMGAMAGLLAALECPQRFRALLFISASPRYLDDVGYRGGLAQGQLESLYAAMSSNFQAWAAGFDRVSGELARPPGFAHELFARLSNLRPDVALAVARIIFEFDFRRMLPKLRTPTVIVQGTHDRGVPADVGRYLARELPNARLELVQGSGPLPHIYRPEQVNDILRALLR